MRIRAIANSMYYGLMPYWMYEEVKHYNCSYWQHLLINIKYAIRWATFNEDQSDIEFENQTNG